MLCTESTTTSLGCVCLDVRGDALQVRVGQHQDVRRDDAQPLGAQLDLRGRLLAGDVEHRAAGRSASAAQSWISSVHLPMPGSPLISTTEPGTMPPPSTRLSSPMDTGMRS